MSAKEITMQEKTQVLQCCLSSAHNDVKMLSGRIMHADATNLSEASGMLKKATSGESRHARTEDVHGREAVPYIRELWQKEHMGVEEHHA